MYVSGNSKSWSLGPLRKVLGEQRGSVVLASLALCCLSQNPGPLTQGLQLGLSHKTIPLCSALGSPSGLFHYKQQMGFFLNIKMYLVHYLSIKQIRKRCHVATKLQPRFTKKSISENLRCPVAPELCFLRSADSPDHGRLAWSLLNPQSKGQFCVLNSIFLHFMHD